MAIAAPVSDGLYLVGEFLGLSEWRKDRSWTARDGSTQVERPCDVRLLVGAGIVPVQFPSIDAASAAVAGAKDRDMVSLRVVNKHGVKNGAAWQFYTAADADA